MGDAFNKIVLIYLSFRKTNKQTIDAINDYEKEKQFRKLNAKKEDRPVKVNSPLKFFNDRVWYSWYVIRYCVVDYLNKSIFKMLLLVILCLLNLETCLLLIVSILKGKKKKKKSLFVFVVCLFIPDVCNTIFYLDTMYDVTNLLLQVNQKRLKKMAKAIVLSWAAPKYSKVLQR